MDGAAALIDDTVDDTKSKASAFADGLGREEGVKDVCLAVDWDAGAVILDEDADLAFVVICLDPSAEADVT